MKKLKILFLLVAPVLIATFFFTVRISDKLASYEEKKMEKAELLNVENRATNIWEWMPSWLSPGEDVMEQSWELDREAKAYYRSAMIEGGLFLIVIVAFLVTINLIYKDPAIRSQAIGLSLIIASLCFFYLGINEPFIEVEAYKDDFSFSEDIGIEGRVYFFYMNKSVMTLINLLYSGGNYFVAIAIIVFSIVFPLIKLGSSFVIFLVPSSKYSKKAVSLIDKLGKWSMVDVYVAAAWLSYFSFANTEFPIDTGSETLLGLYFFTAFVIFSIISGIYLKRTVIRAMTEKA